MRFKGLDLNLMVALDHLLTERNVSRAADKLFLSQSATSGALARLREFFGDDLLVPVGRKMTLTPRAQELAVAIRAALMQIETTIIEQPRLDLSTARRSLRVITSDYVGIAFFARVVQSIQAEAPGISFTFVTPSSDATRQIARGQVDLAVMPERFLVPDHPSQLLFADGYAVIVDAQNTRVGGVLDLETFMALPQVSVQLIDGPPSYETALADRFGNSRVIDVLATNFSSVPFFVLGTQRAAIVHQRLAQIVCRMMPLRMYPPPMPLPELRIALQWHQLADGDPLLRHVRTRILELAAAEGL
ncbi:LysR family transcriptional regulator [Pararhodobacter aggregans]